MIKIFTMCAIALSAQLACAQTKTPVRPAGVASGPAIKAICLPTEAGGIGTQYTMVYYPDDKVVIHTYLCNGQQMWVFGLDSWSPLHTQPAKPGTLAAELKKLYVQMGYMRESSAPYDAKAKQQFEQYQLSPAEIRKKSVKANQSLV